MKTIETGLTFGMAFDSIRGSVKKPGMRLPYWKDDVMLTVEKRELGFYLKITLYKNGLFDVFYPSQEELFNNEWEVVELEEGELKQ